MIEEIWSSETSGFLRNSQMYNPEDRTLLTCVFVVLHFKFPEINGSSVMCIEFRVISKIPWYSAPSNFSNEWITISLRIRVDQDSKCRPWSPLSLLRFLRVPRYLRQIQDNILENTTITSCKYNPIQNASLKTLGNLTNRNPRRKETTRKTKT
jgi:hypothetical protein